MAERNDLLAKVLEVIMKQGRGSFRGGSIQGGTLDDLALLNEKYVRDGLFLPEHAIFSRFDKSGWSPERIAEGYGALMNESATRGVPNIAGGNRTGAEALWLENGPTSLFSPVIPHKGGSMSLTIMEPYTSRIKQNMEELGWSPGERLFSPSDVTPAHIGSRSANSLRSGADPFSAVGSQPTLEEIVGNIFNEVKNSKKAMPYILGGGAAGAATLGASSESEAANIGPRGFQRLFGNELTDATPGAFRGAEGMLRYEIPDKQMSLTPDFRKRWEDSKQMSPAQDFLDGAVSHPQLFEAYPEMRDFDIFARRTPGEKSGQAYSDGITAEAPDLQSLLDIIAHENQHSIQGIEGFASGSTPEMAGGYRQYLDTPGEREAREVERRRTMTDSERNNGHGLFSGLGIGSLGEPAGRGLRDILEGITSLPDMAARPVANTLNWALGGEPEYFQSSGGGLADLLGLPKSDREGLASAITQSVAGGLAGGGAAGLRSLGSGAARYGLGDLGFDTGFGAALSAPGLKWIWGER